MPAIKCEKIKLHGREYMLYKDSLIATEDQIRNLNGSYAAISESGGVYRAGELVAIRSEIEFSGEYVEITPLERGVRSCLGNWLNGLKGTSETKSCFHSFQSLVESMGGISKRSREA